MKNASLVRKPFIVCDGKKLGFVGSSYHSLCLSCSYLAEYNANIPLTNYNKKQKNGDCPRGFITLGNVKFSEYTSKSSQ